MIDPWKLLIIATPEQQQLQPFLLSIHHHHLSDHWVQWSLYCRVHIEQGVCDAMQGCWVWMLLHSYNSCLSPQTDQFCGIHLWEYLHGMETNCDTDQTPWGCISFLAFYLHIALQLIASNTSPFQSRLLFGLSFFRSLLGNQLTRLPEGLLNATTKLQEL